MPVAIERRDVPDIPMLLFKKKFLDDIRSGRKTQTIRLWKCRHMRAGQRSYIPGVGPIRITSVEAVDLRDLTDADAVPDGFASARALRRELRTIYGERLKNGHQAYRIVFARMAEGTALKTQTPARRRGPAPAGGARDG